MTEEIIDVGLTKFNIADVWYQKFCNKYEKEETTKASRSVFQFDWQRFVWAFILGISVEKRTPIENKTKNPPFGKEVFDRRQKILKTMIGLTMQEMYKNNPDKLKDDFELASKNGENLGKAIKVAIEEYANTGFSILERRGIEKPGYIENIEYVVEDILSNKKWCWE